MNDLLVRFGLEPWKPLLGLLLLPPVPLVLLAVLGGLWLPRRRLLGWLSLGLALLGLWGMGSMAVGRALVEHLTTPPPALDAGQRAGLVGAPRTAIVVLGAGRRLLAPEYGAPDLTPMTLERLRYGLWLARQTHLPVLSSGGVGFGDPPGPTEAAIVAQVALRDFGQRLRWSEDRSRDTNENARFTVALLRAEGIRRIVLVTHDFHQRRALAAFERALLSPGPAIALLPAPMGRASPRETRLLDFLPTDEGFALSRQALHEWLGRLGGA